MAAAVEFDPARLAASKLRSLNEVFELRLFLTDFVPNHHRGAPRRRYPIHRHYRHRV